MLYCLDYLAANLDWLQDKLAPLIEGAPARQRSRLDVLRSWPCDLAVPACTDTTSLPVCRLRVSSPSPLLPGGCYLLFDCPGQVELFTQAPSLKAVVDALAASSALRLAVVHLVDAHLATDPAK